MSLAGPATRLARQAAGFWLRAKRPAAPPLSLWVDITSRCNLACPACPQKSLPPAERRHMDDALLVRLVDQIPALGCRVNLFHRGEPLLRPDLAAWTGRFRAAGASVRLHSNATLLHRDRVEALLASPPELLTLSVDSLDPAAYGGARPGAELGRTLCGVKLLLQEKRRRGARLPLITLLLMGEQPGGPAARDNLRQLLELGLDRVIRRRPHNWGGLVGGPATGRRPSVCTFPWYGLAVLSDGRVCPCPQDFFGAMNLGDANVESLADIWRGDALARLRRAQAGHVLDGWPVCAVCDRVRRPTILGVPIEHARNFLREMRAAP